MSCYVDKLDYISLAHLENSALSDTSLTACSITLFFQILVYKIKSNLSLGKVVRTLFPKKQRYFSSPFFVLLYLTILYSGRKTSQDEKAHFSKINTISVSKAENCREKFYDFELPSYPST